MSYKVFKDREYHYSHESIVCNADKEGAELFEIRGELGVRTVLAHSEEMAKEAYQRELEKDWRYCSECNSIRCSCSPEEDEDDLA